MTTKPNFNFLLNMALFLIMALLGAVQWFNGDDSITSYSQTYKQLAAEAQASVCSATVNTRRLNQRSGPAETYAIVGDVRQGQVVYGASWDTSRTWLLVSTDEGTAWMYGSYLTLGEHCANLPAYSAVPDSDGITTVGLAIQSPAIPMLNVANSTATTVSAVFTPEVRYWASKIEEWAKTYDLDPNLIATVMQIESCGDPTVGSNAGAQGLFQVMPFHFANGEDMLDVDTNAARGLAYLKGALKLTNGDVGLALVGYNGGYGAINGTRYAETQRYYYWGSGIYAEATSGATQSPTLQEWLDAGGSSLCTRASRSQSSLS